MKDQLLQAFVTLRVDEDPLVMRAARVRLGTASWGERWRHFWGLPATPEEIKSAESARHLHELMERMRREYGGKRSS